MQQDPRYWLQRLKAHPEEFAGRLGFPYGRGLLAGARLLSASLGRLDLFGGAGLVSVAFAAPPPPKKGDLSPDWSVSLGNASTTVGDGQYPAKFTFNPPGSASCTNDFAVFGTGKPGSTGGQASIIGLKNLYSGATGNICGTTGPTFFFAYNTSTNNQSVVTSPALSLDGTKVAFVESANPPIFHVLTIGTGGGTDSLHSVAPATGSGSLVSITYGNMGDAVSSPFPDYGNDVAYVGADDGCLYKFTTVFTGTPTLVGSGASNACTASHTGWPVPINSGHKLTSPTLDFGTQKVFIGDDAGVLYFVTGVNTSTPTLGSPTFTVASNKQLFDGPLVDSTNGTVFEIVADNGNCSGCGNGFADVVQADFSLSTSSQVRTHVGKNGGGLSTPALSTTPTSPRRRARVQDCCTSAGTAPTITSRTFMPSALLRVLTRR